MHVSGGSSFILFFEVYLVSFVVVVVFSFVSISQVNCGEGMTVVQY